MSLSPLPAGVRWLLPLLAGGMVACQSVPPKVVHAKPPPEVMRMLRHPALRITDDRQGHWVRGMPRTARQGWEGDGWEGAANNLTGDGNAAFSVLGFLTGFVLVNVGHSLVAPSAEKIAQARQAIDQTVSTCGWRQSIYEGFMAEARKHGIASAVLMPEGSGWDCPADSLIDVVVREAHIGTSSPHPTFDLAWRVHRQGVATSVWYGNLEAESPEGKGFLEWGDKGGQALAKALRELFQDAGRKLAVELYAGIDVTL